MSGAKAQGRLRGRKPVAVIDIGSNSVRLVIYEGLVRSATVLFNEKILCGLGRGVATSKRLEQSAVDMALRTLKRFRVLCAQIGTKKIYALATAAVREADNGHDFIVNATEILATKIKVLTGKQEAEYSAMGVISTFYKPEGLVGDLGGGSLELVGIDGQNIGDGATLPLGGIRLQDMSSGQILQATHIAHSYLQKASFVQQYRGQVFYAVGGTWRNLAKLYMLEKNYPLPVMHAYELDTKEVTSFLQRVVEKGANAMLGIAAISKSRRQLLSYGAIVLIELLRVMQPKKIIFSGAGVREGYLYSRLPQRVQQLDPLLSAAEETAVLHARSPKHAYEMVAWTTSAFQVFNLKETDKQKRYREAACFFSDIGWRVHPDYRGNQAASQIAFGAYPGATHPGRVFIALAVFFRNEGLVNDAQLPDFINLVAPRVVERAKILGAIMRVANVFCMSTSELLLHFQWQKCKGGAQLIVPQRYQDLIAERPIGRLRQLSKLLEIPLEYAIDE